MKINSIPTSIQADFLYNTIIYFTIGIKPYFFIVFRPNKCCIYASTYIETVLNTILWLHLNLIHVCIRPVIFFDYFQEILFVGLDFLACQFELINKVHGVMTFSAQNRASSSLCIFSIKSILCCQGKTATQRCSFGSA